MNQVPIPQEEAIRLFAQNIDELVSTTAAAFLAAKLPALIPTKVIFDHPTS